MNSSKLTGNQAAAQIITRMLSNQAVPHALLFHGQNGVGKSILAKEVAEGLMGSSHIEKFGSKSIPI